MYMLQWKCVISDFMKSLKFSVTSWNYCFSRGFHETTEIPSYLMKSLKISTVLFTILLTWIVRALGNLWNRICGAYPQLDTGPQLDPRTDPQLDPQQRQTVLRSSSAVNQTSCWSCFPAGRHFPTSKCSSDNG